MTHADVRKVEQGRFDQSEHNSRTDEILARGVESREVRGAAMRREETMITRWEDVDLLTDRWALAAREGLEDLVSFDGS